MPNFSQRLDFCMKHRGFTGATLSSATKISEATISRYLNEQRTPTMQNLITLSDSLNVSSDFLLGLSDTPEDKILTAAYSVASEDDKNVIWAILQKYGVNYEKTTDRK